MEVRGQVRRSPVLPSSHRYKTHGKLGDTQSRSARSVKGRFPFAHRKKHNDSSVVQDVTLSLCEQIRRKGKR
jgi:hypothetical protein